MQKKRRRGRPSWMDDLTEEQLEQLKGLVAGMGEIYASMRELSAVISRTYKCGFSPNVASRLFERFPELEAAYLEAKESCKTALRRKQLELAMEGDRGMLIWLGKQMLGQADKQEVSGSEGGPLVIKWMSGDGNS